MTVQLSQPDFQRIIKIVSNLPGFGTTVYERRRFVEGAFGGEAKANIILVQLNLDVSAQKIGEKNHPGSHD